METARALLLHSRTAELEFNVQGAYFSNFIGLVCNDHNESRRYPSLRLLACQVVAELERKAVGCADLANVCHPFA
jgi:hypothetical protein